MEDKYIFEREYSISADIFREGYLAFQKKYIYLKSYIFMGIFLILAADMAYAITKDNDNYFAYILMVLCLAMAFREWYNPRRIRRNLVETVKSMGEPVYKISVGDGFVDIATVSVPDEIEGDDGEDSEYEGEPEEHNYPELPEPTRMPDDEQMKILEYEKFFLLLYGKNLFYIIPKEKFEEKELDIIRKLGKKG